MKNVSKSKLLRIMALVLSIMLIIGTVAGCGKKETSKKGDGNVTLKWVIGATGAMKDCNRVFAEFNKQLQKYMPGTTVEFEVNERLEGESKWSAIGLLKYAISNISAYSTAPMQIVTVLGVMMLIITAIFSVWALIDKIRGIALEGMTTVIIILIFIGSIMMISLGIIGYYVARIYDEIKGRPKYIVSATCRSKEKVK